jgi:acetyltransferase-like isoleucine patch superfamily enzyme
MADDSRSLFERFLHGQVRPIAKRVVHRAVNPPAALKPLCRAIFETHWGAREVAEWAERSLLATPVFLAKCARHGERIAIDRIPYMTAPCHIELGDEVRFSGQINIKPDSKRSPRLIIGNGVFVGHNTTFDVAQSITLGNFVSIGSQCYIADTEGHAHYNPERPIWEVPGAQDIQTTNPRHTSSSDRFDRPATRSIFGHLEPWSKLRKLSASFQRAFSRLEHRFPKLRPHAFSPPAASLTRSPAASIGLPHRNANIN